MIRMTNNIKLITTLFTENIFFRIIFFENFFLENVLEIPHNRGPPMQEKRRAIIL